MATEILPPDLQTALAERKRLLSMCVKEFLYTTFDAAMAELAAWDRSHPDVVQYLKERATKK